MRWTLALLVGRLETRVWGVARPRLVALCPVFEVRQGLGLPEGAALGRPPGGRLGVRRGEARRAIRGVCGGRGCTECGPRERVAAIARAAPPHRAGLRQKGAGTHHRSSQAGIMCW